LRREVLGDAALGQENLEMIEIGRKLSAPQNFPVQVGQSSASSGMRGIFANCSEPTTKEVTPA